MNLHHSPYTIDLNQSHHHHHHHHHQQQQQLYDHQILLHRHSFSNSQPHSSPSSSWSPLYSNPLEDHQLGFICTGSQLRPSLYQQEEEVDNKTIPHGNGGSYDQTTIEINGEKRTNLKFTICKKEDQSSGSNVKWMPVRIMKKMMRGNEDLKPQPPYVGVEDKSRHVMSKTLMANSENISGNDNNNTGIRVCSDCNTTKTPLWRSGPRGPKSLCNACGIRQRKARRAMAMATNGCIPSSLSRAGNAHKKIANNNKAFGVHKKQSKVVKPSPGNHHCDAQRKLWFEEFALKLSKKLPIQQVFPQEEKEAAILLMALSCGFVHG